MNSFGVVANNQQIIYKDLRLLLTDLHKNNQRGTITVYRGTIDITKWGPLKKAFGKSYFKIKHEQPTTLSTAKIPEGNFTFNIRPKLNMDRLLYIKQYIQEQEFTTTLTKATTDELAYWFRERHLVQTHIGLQARKCIWNEIKNRYYYIIPLL